MGEIEAVVLYDICVDGGRTVLQNMGEVVASY